MGCLQKQNARHNKCKNLGAWLSPVVAEVLLTETPFPFLRTFAFTLFIFVIIIFF